MIKNINIVIDLRFGSLAPDVKVEQVVEESKEDQLESTEQYDSPPIDDIDDDDIPF